MRANKQDEHKFPSSDARYSLDFEHPNNYRLRHIKTISDNPLGNWVGKMKCCVKTKASLKMHSFREKAVSHKNTSRLRVSKVQVRDRGFYHCQLATHPPQVSSCLSSCFNRTRLVFGSTLKVWWNQVIWTYLDIARPFFRIYNSENGTLEDQHYHRGSKIGLQCEVYHQS